MARSKRDIHTMDKIKVVISNEKLKSLLFLGKMTWVERICRCPPGCECCDDPHSLYTLFNAHRRRIVIKREKQERGGFIGS